jgi:hypothetical protein
LILKYNNREGENPKAEEDGKSKSVDMERILECGNRENPRVWIVCESKSGKWRES